MAIHCVATGSSIDVSVHVDVAICTDDGRNYTRRVAQLAVYFGPLQSFQKVTVHAVAIVVAQVRFGRAAVQVVEPKVGSEGALIDQFTLDDKGQLGEQRVKVRVEVTATYFCFITLFSIRGDERRDRPALERPSLRSRRPVCMLLDVALLLDCSRQGDAGRDLWLCIAFAFE